MATPSTRELLQLDVQARLKLIDELWESVVNDLNDPDKPNPLPVSTETRALLDERIGNTVQIRLRACAGRTCRSGFSR